MMRTSPTVLALLVAQGSHCASVLAADKLNLLMVISDQHRWDCLSEAGHPIIKTPNLDQLAKDGVHFTRAYTVCPVCCPSRTSMLAGQTPEQTQVRGNSEMATGPRMMTYDRVLLANGWGGEYHGKYHSPYNYTRDENLKTYYSRPVLWLNGKGPNVKSAEDYKRQSMSTTYRAYLDKAEPLKQLQPGQLLDSMYQRPYWADIADLRYNQTFNHTLLEVSNRLISEGNAAEVPTTDQQHVNGRLALSANHSYSALTLNEGMAALGRLKDAPFTLTVSFEAPHPPFIIPYPFYGMYDPSSIADPVTVEDPMTASPYHHPHSPSGDEAQVRQQKSNYFGMIAQNDKMVGDLLSKLEEFALTSRTLVVYIADHGEMLGDHHMQSKMVFYEGSVHIPLILRLPGIIPSGKVVDEPVSNMALFGTITDYLGLPAAAPPTSKSLRPLIEGSRDSADAADDDRVVFSFWDSDISPGFMAFDGRFKLMIGRQEKTDASRCCSPDVQCMIPAHDEIDVDYRTVPCEVDAQGFDAPGVDALYDHLYDPKEVINLLRSPYVRTPGGLSRLKPHHQADQTTTEGGDHIVPFDQAESLKAKLVGWLQETGSDYASPVAKRQMNTSHINQVPVLAGSLPAQVTWYPGQTNVLSLPDGLFVDVDGDSLTFAGTLDRAPLPDWLRVHPTDGSVHGNPPNPGSLSREGNGKSNSYLLRVTATDRKTGYAFVEIRLNVS